jgi:hypothetical protein
VRLRAQSCLGGLGPLNQSHDCIHTAIYMLLTSLEQVEEALCLPLQVRHASALQGLDGLASPVSKQRDLEPALIHGVPISTTEGIRDMSELGRKAKEIQELLHHHTDL